MTEWNIDEIICKYTPRIYAIEHHTQNIDLKGTDAVSYKDIQESYELMANIVTEHGEEYLPIFARLHDELENHIAKRNLLSTAFKISNETNDHKIH